MPTKPNKKMPNQCAPNRKSHTDTCLTLAELQSVAALYNKGTSPGPGPGPGQIPLSAFGSQKDLLKHLEAKFAPVCKSRGETCWLEQDIFKGSRDLYNALTRAYRPPKPSSWKKNRREWLNTYDILNVMKQYEEAAPTLEFLGVFPVDFAEQAASGSCVIQSMCKFDIGALKTRGKTAFGIVLNLDRHDQPGSHWVACYCCLDPDNPKYGICYYDSGGDPPPPLILNFIKTVYRQVDDAPRFQKRFNPTQHQFQDTECGIFAMLFIALCLEHTQDTYRAVRKRIKRIASDPQDKNIHAFRDFFYRE